MIKKLIFLLEGRSPLWGKVRAQHLKEQPECQVCKGTKVLEVHHLIPFKVNPALELDPNNLITLCESGDWGLNCHLWFGHLGNFSTYNKDCVKDVYDWRTKKENAAH